MQISSSSDEIETLTRSEKTFLKRLNISKKPKKRFHLKDEYEEKEEEGIADNFSDQEEDFDNISVPLSTSFQSTMTLFTNEARFLVWNEIGKVIHLNPLKIEEIIKVDFSDVDFHPSLSLKLPYKIQLADISNNGLVLVYKRTEDNIYEVAFRPFHTQEKKLRKICTLENGKEIVSISTFGNLIAIATNNNKLRIFSIYGRQFVPLQLENSIISCVGFSSYNINIKRNSEKFNAIINSNYCNAEGDEFIAVLVKLNKTENNHFENNFNVRKQRNNESIKEMDKLEELEEYNENFQNNILLKIYKKCENNEKFSKIFHYKDIFLPFNCIKFIRFDAFGNLYLMSNLYKVYLLNKKTNFCIFEILDFKNRNDDEFDEFVYWPIFIRGKNIFYLKINSSQENEFPDPKVNNLLEKERFDFNLIGRKEMIEEERNFIENEIFQSESFYNEEQKNNKRMLWEKKKEELEKDKNIILIINSLLKKNVKNDLILEFANELKNEISIKGILKLCRSFNLFSMIEKIENLWALKQKTNKEIRKSADYVEGNERNRNYIKKEKETEEEIIGDVENNSSELVINVEKEKDSNEKNGEENREMETEEMKKEENISNRKSFVNPFKLR